MAYGSIKSFDFLKKPEEEEIIPFPATPEEEAAAIEQHPGPVADVGFNPNNPGPADIRANGDSLFKRISEQTQLQQLQGNLPDEVPGSIQSMAKNRQPSAESALQKMVDAPPPQQANVGYGDELGDAGLKAALEQQAMMQRIAALGKAGSMIGSGIAGMGAPGAGKLDFDASWDAIGKLGNLDVDAIKTRRAGKDAEAAREGTMMDLNNKKEMNDPNSPQSQMFRSLLKDRMPKLNVPENLSAARISEMSPMIKALAEKEMSEYQKQALMRRDRDLEQRGAKEGRLGEQFSYRKGEKFQDDVNKAIERMRKTDTWAVAEKTLVEVPTIQNMLDDAYTKGGNSLAMLGPKVAKAIAGEVGVLTETDVTRYVKNPSIVGGLMDSIQKAKSGKISQASYENLKRLLEISKQEAERKMKFATQREAMNLSKNEGISLEEAEYYLDPSNKPRHDASSESPKESAASQQKQESGKSITKKEYSKSRDKTRITYSDGSTELVDGRQ